MYQERVSLYEQIEDARSSKVIAYITGDRPQLETKMSSEVLDFFVYHLDKFRVAEKISIILYTRGGETLSAWTLANLLRTFCDSLEIIIPSKCHSAGTLLCLGADALVMTKQATLGPIDPSVNTPLNPVLPGGQPAARVPINVEDVNAFLEHARELFGDSSNLMPVFERLAQNVHPLVLGNAFRARSQIRMLGSRLLSNHMSEQGKMEKILDFLCSESGSHDYTVNRREARDELGLPVEKPSWEFYELIKSLYSDIAMELELTASYDPNLILGGNNSSPYSFTRAIIESPKGGSHVFISEGSLSRQRIQVQPNLMQDAINDQRQFEGWRHRDA